MKRKLLVIVLISFFFSSLASADYETDGFGAEITIYDSNYFIIQNPYPDNNSVVYALQPELFFTLINPNDSNISFNVTVGTSPGSCNTFLYGEAIKTNGTYHCCYFQAVDYGETYYWKLSVFHELNLTTELYSFSLGLVNGSGNQSGMIMVHDSFSMVIGFSGFIFSLMAMILVFNYRKKS